MIDPDKVDRYVVMGPGRTGSHWVEQIVKFVIGFNDCSGQPSPVSHTHDFNLLTALPQSQRNRYCVLVVYRRDFFAQMMSLAISHHIDEWFVYSDKPIEPFEIDPTEFQKLCRRVRYWDQQFDEIIRPNFENVVDVYYEDLVADYNHVEDRVASLIGIKNQYGSKSWEINRNPRNYRDLVLNWQELQQFCR